MNKYNLQTSDKTIVRINNFEHPNETNKLLNNYFRAVGNSNSIHPDLNDKLCTCCYWSLIIGISGTLIGTTIWCLVKYYS